MEHWLGNYSGACRYTLPHRHEETFRNWGCLATMSDISSLTQVNILAEPEGRALGMAVGRCQESYREERKASTRRTISLLSTLSLPAATIGELPSKLHIASCAGIRLGTLSCCMGHSCIEELTKPGTFLKWGQNSILYSSMYIELSWLRVISFNRHLSASTMSFWGNTTRKKKAAHFSLSKPKEYANEKDEKGYLY